jgi:hypothetical protein
MFDIYTNLTSNCIIKTTKIIRQTKNNTKLHDYLNIDRERVRRSTQRINLQSQTGRSVPNNGYTAINITISLQYFSSARLASSTNINILHTINIFSSSNNTEPKYTESYSRPNRFAGKQACPLQIRRNHIGNGGPYRTRAADVGNVMCDETEFSVTKDQN